MPLLVGTASAAAPTFLTSFGDPGNELAVERLAVNEETGDVYVINSNKNTVDHFSSAGVLLGELTGKGQKFETLGINGAEGIDSIAVDNTKSSHKGWVYLTGKKERVITAFNAAGVVQWQTSLVPPNRLCGIAVDPSGNLWIANQSEGVRQLGTEHGEELGKYFAANGTAPCDLAFDGVGDLYLSAGQIKNGVITETAMGKYAPPITESTPTVVGAGGFYVDLATDLSSEAVYGIRESAGNEGPEAVSYTSTGASLYPAFTPHGAVGFKGITIDAKRKLIYLTDNENKVEVWTTATSFDYFNLNVNGSGSVECELEGASSFGPCPSAFLEDEGKTVTLKAKPGSGYVLAGWLGCRQSSPETCVVKLPVGVGATIEVTAVFFKEGTQGAKGEPGAPGSNGSNGSNGAAGPQGAKGPAGAQGPAGPQGLQGKEGPAGKVTCQVKQKGKKVKVTCTVKASAAAAGVHWRLTHGGRTVRHGTSNGGLRLDLSHLRAGHYRLHVQGQSGSASIVIA